jgi:mRNA-degrading endonuclease toxin of MazEF toxin-antitoxin module
VRGARRLRFLGPVLRVRFRFRFRGGRRGLVRDVDGGLVRGEDALAARAAIIASSNPAARSPPFILATALSTQPAKTPWPVSMPISRADRSAGTFP